MIDGIGEKEIQEAEDWIKVQIEQIDPNSKGIIIFTYGTEDYMVSSNAARKLYEKAAPLLKEKFPNHISLFMPFWMKLTDIKELDEIDR